jgi:cyclic-di-GMP-binding protein
MPSFDVVCEADTLEIRNAIDQANREIGTRFDFKGSDSKVEIAEFQITIHAEDEFKAGQVMDILNTKMAKRNVNLDFLKPGDVKEVGGNKVVQQVTLQNGIDTDMARKLVKLIKTTKIKVQTAIQGEQLRINGKKRDDLQQVITFLKEQQLDRPLQYVNFRD